MNISWDTLAEIPPPTWQEIQYGLAGVLAGSIGEKIVIAGGSNFADKIPWLGGTKLFYDDIFLVAETQKDEFIWELSELKLPAKMAYSASVSFENAIYCFGGEDPAQPLDFVLKIYFENNSLQIKQLPVLPIAVSNAGAAIIDSKVYVAGGNDSVGATSHFQMLDLSDIEKGWTVLPGLPEVESHGVVVSQSDGKEECIYVLGGRNKTGITSTFFSSIYKYSPSENSWTKTSSLQLDGGKEFGLSAGTGVAFGNNSILLFGGDKGIIFNKTEQLINAFQTETDSLKKAKINAEKIELLSNHPGFSKEILCFDTHSGKLELVGEIPGLTQVTTCAFWRDNKVIIPGGEIRPGVRSSAVRAASVKLN